jgi:hypothetical protein
MVEADDASQLPPMVAFVGMAGLEFVRTLYECLLMAFRRS